ASAGGENGEDQWAARRRLPMIVRVSVLGKVAGRVVEREPGGVGTRDQADAGQQMQDATRRRLPDAAVAATDRDAVRVVERDGVLLDRGETVIGDGDVDIDEGTESPGDNGARADDCGERHRRGRVRGAPRLQ